MNVRLLASCAVLLSAACLAAAQISPVPAAPAGARWSDPATWGGAVPGPGARVIVPAGASLALDTATAPLDVLEIRGTLAATGPAVALTARAVFVHGGRLEIGTAAAPFRGRATVTLTGRASDPDAVEGMGNKVLAVMGGTLSLHGAPVAQTWTKLARDVSTGGRVLQLAAAPGWRAGDRIVVATSSRDMLAHDVATIQSIDGATITLAAPLRFPHLGELRRVGDATFDLRAEVGLLSHNVLVRGDDTSAATGFGGHAMFMNHAHPGTTPQPAVIQIAHVEFTAMGQLNRLGRYPLHFHEMGRADGSYVRDSAVHTTVQRGIVLHAVSGIALERNVVFDTVGHNIVVEDARTTGNFLRGNLALVNRQPNPLHTEPTLVTQNDRLPSNFWLKSGANHVEGNTAAGAFASGFIYDLIGPEPVTILRNTAHAALDAEGAGEADFDLAAGILLASYSVRPATERIEENLVYHNSVGFWPEEVGPFKILRLTAVDNTLHTENRGVGNRATYTDCVFAGRVTEPGLLPPTAIHFQYGSIVDVINPLFAGYDGGLTAMTTDSQPAQSIVTWRNFRATGTPPLRAPHDDMVSIYPDDSLVPRGSYVPLAFPEFASPAARRWVAPETASWGADRLEFWRDPAPLGYAELDVRDRARVGTRLFRTVPLRRGDGLRFTSQASMFGYTVIHHPAGTGYEIEKASASGYAFRLGVEALIDPEVRSDLLAAGLTFPAHDPASFTDATVVPLTVPVAAAPRGVHRTGKNLATPNAPTAANALRLARDAADFAANPLTTYRYDATAKKILVHASSRWVVIVP